MKNIFLLALYIITILLYGCMSNKIANDDVYRVQVNLNTSKDIMDKIESLQVLHLEEDSLNFPGAYSNVKWKGDSMYILDIFKSRGLYLYNPDGKLIRFYNKVGQGPDEFLGLSDFILTDNEIILLDTYSNPNKIYLDSNFKFIRKEEAEENAAHFAIDNKGGFWYDRGNIAHSDNKDKLVYQLGNKRISVLKIPKILEDITFSNFNSFFQLGNDTIAYLPVLEPLVYKCHNGEATEWLEFDFGDKWPVLNSESSTIHPFALMKKIAEEGKIYSLNMNFDDGHLVFTFNCDDKFYILLLKQDEPDYMRLYHVDNSQLEKFGPFLSMHKGQLYFGEEVKIVKVSLKSN